MEPCADLAHVVDDKARESSAGPSTPSSPPAIVTPASSSSPPRTADAFEKTKVLTDSTFFKEKRAPSLPTPDEVRAVNEAIGTFRATFVQRPYPVKFEPLGLLVKYGSDVAPAEAQTQLMVRKRLGGRVPVPEVYGWTEDGEQRFIYMELMEGDTLEVRWRGMSEEERMAVCGELREMVSAWRGLKHGDDAGKSSYIGGLHDQPLYDIFFTEGGNCRPCRPYKGADALRCFEYDCWIEREGEEIDVVFTHADFTPPNILVSRGPNPKVVAMIDWCQSGWYPAYWEYCKARMVGLQKQFFDQAEEHDWYFKYLPLMMAPVDEERVYHPYLRFVLSRGC